MSGPKLLVIGAGNELRRDDAAGLEAARRCADVTGVEVREARGDMTSLADLWDAADRVVVVDAARSGAAPGSVHRFDATSVPLPAAFGRGSTHALGVADAVELARALGRLPAQLIVYGIEGEDFSAGEGMSEAVVRGVADAATQIVGELPDA